MCRYRCTHRISDIAECTKVSRVPDWLYEAQNPQWPNVNEFGMTLDPSWKEYTVLKKWEWCNEYIILKLQNPTMVL